MSKTLLPQNESVISTKTAAPFWSKGWFGTALAVLIGTACFWLALVPVHTVQTALQEYTDGRIEQADNTTYIWLRPQLSLGYRDLPRFAPINLKLSLSLDRPADAPPAQLQVAETQEGQAPLALLNLQYSPEKRGFQEYLITIPASQNFREDLFLDFKSNGFRVTGDTRQLGVRLAQASLSVSKSGLILAVFKQPLFPATLILLIGMALWAYLVGFRTLETILLLAPVGFLAGGLANQLIYSSWWLLLDSLILVGLALVYGRRKAEHDRLKRFTIKTSVLSPQSSVLPLYAAILVFYGFFVVAPSWPGDIFYMKGWLKAILENGPFGVYSHAVNLNHFPGVVYLFAGYGFLTQPFGFQFEDASFKGLMGVGLLLIIGLIWWIGRRTGLSREQLHRTLLLFGFSLSFMFIPLVWVQSDSWLLWLMALPLALTIAGKPLASAAVEAYALIFKPQAWFLLPFYGFSYFLRFGFKKSLIGGALCVGLAVILGAAGFAFSLKEFQFFLGQPGVTEQVDWPGVSSFNMLHLLGYDALRPGYGTAVPQPLLSISYGMVGLIYLVVLWVAGRRRVALRQEKELDATTLAARLGAEWFLGAAVVLCSVFFFWIRMHERYLYYGLGFLLMATLYRRALFKPALLLNLLFSLNLLYAYLPQRRDPIPNNFFFWRHFMHADAGRNLLCVAGILTCGWLIWLYLRPDRELNLTTDET